MKKILVANRGEIAQSAIRCIREMGLTSVAVYSEVEPDAIHIIDADYVCGLPGAHPAMNYGSVERVVDAAVATGSDAVYSGYGFLSESAKFARACKEKGVTFIGPDADLLTACKDKPNCLELAESLGIPVPPHSDLIESEDDLVEKAAAIGYPVLLKPRSGTGGRRMAKAYRRDDLVDSYRKLLIEREIRGTDTPFYIEKFIKATRHVEFPVLADTHGHLVHFNERESSVQRRFQKIVSESPSPGLAPETREKMAEAALLILRKLNFYGCCSAEFLLGEGGRWCFMEINPRIPVEYALTDIGYGVEMIKEQILVASGQPISVKKSPPPSPLHCIECRVNAEDPRRDFQPSSGVIQEFYLPGGYGYSVLSGVRKGRRVDIYYDPMILKIDCFAQTREGALAKLQFALDSIRIKGVKTNIPFLRHVVASDQFQSHDVTCDLKIKDFVQTRSRDKVRMEVAAVVAALEHEMRSRYQTSLLKRPGDATVWNMAGRLDLIQRRGI